MRVAYVCADPGVPVFGTKGSSIHVQEIVSAMLRRGFDVELFAGAVGGTAPPHLSAMTLEELPRVAEIDDASRELQLLARNEALESMLQSSGTFDLVYERYSLWSHAAIDFAAANDIPSILEVNAPLIDEQAKHRVLVHADGARAIAIHLFRTATVIAAVSEQVAAYVSSLSGRRDGIVVVPNGISAERFAQQPVPSGEHFTLVFLGTLKPWHGLGLLVDLFDAFHRRHEESRLLVVGDGPERESLQNDLARRGLDGATTLTGAVAPDRVPALLASADVALAPYPEESGFYFSPLKVVEYMAAGLPIVATRVGQIEDLIRDGSDGLLRRADRDEFVAALETLHSDPALRARLGDAARAKAFADLTWDSVLERMLAPLHMEMVNGRAV